jgi:hypothetical protein
VQLYVANIFSPRDSIKFVLTTSWGMLHHNGNWSNSHTHANSLISGIVYFDTTPDSGELIFSKSVDNLHSDLLQIDAKSYNPFNSQTWGVTPENGQIIIVPPDLRGFYDLAFRPDEQPED